MRKSASVPFAKAKVEREKVIDLVRRYKHVAGINCNTGTVWFPLYIYIHIYIYMYFFLGALFELQGLKRRSLSVTSRHCLIFFLPQSPQEEVW